MKKGGRLLSGLDNEINFIVDREDESHIAYPLPHNPLKDLKMLKKELERKEGVQFSHGIDENIQAQIDAGFVIKGIYEDTNVEGFLHYMNIPTFHATLAEKTLVL